MRLLLVVPTLNPGAIWQDVVNSIIGQSLKVDTTLVIDSGSSDNVIEAAHRAQFTTQTIKPDQFDHGGTRNLALDSYPDHEIVIFMTQDAVLSTSDSLKNLILPFQDDRVVAVCGRQLPRQGAGPIEAHARHFNYGVESFIRTLADRPKYGLKAAFLSNSFAAYRMSALRAVNVFPDPVIFGEDMYVAAKLLKAGGKIAYAADACVYHSHDYSIVQEFKRYFDMGVLHARQSWLREEFGAAEGEGVKFVISEIKYLLRHGSWRIPESLIRTVCKYAGFRLGLAEAYIPAKVKAKMSMSQGYFKKKKGSV